MQNKETKTFLRVLVAAQVVELWRDGKCAAVFPVSTSGFGVGSEPGSYRTPLGRFRVAEKIGEGLPSGAVLRGRQWTGEVAGQGGEEDLVLTRILWLEGLEPHNQNTKERYIYFHGTNQEAKIGTPCSHGCVRLRNADMLALFEAVPPGTPVEIIEKPA
jgi:lipoprotein-anchoring transpeptidase ErfK/SrfK